MKNFLVPDGPRRDANPSPEQMEEGIKPSRHLADGDANQGSEFLDDAIRTKEQPLEVSAQMNVNN